MSYPPHVLNVGNFLWPLFGHLPLGKFLAYIVKISNKFKNLNFQWIVLNYFDAIFSTYNTYSTYLSKHVQINWHEYGNRSSIQYQNKSINKSCLNVNRIFTTMHKQVIIHGCFSIKIWRQHHLIKYLVQDHKQCFSSCYVSYTLCRDHFISLVS